MAVKTRAEDCPARRADRNVHMGTMGTNKGQVFEATFRAVPVPHRRPAAPETAAVDTGDAP